LFKAEPKLAETYSTSFPMTSRLKKSSRRARNVAAENAAAAATDAGVAEMATIVADVAEMATIVETVVAEMVTAVAVVETVANGTVETGTTNATIDQSVNTLKRHLKFRSDPRPSDSGQERLAAKRYSRMCPKSNAQSPNLRCKAWQPYARGSKKKT
jgi:hypothetical protein